MEILPFRGIHYSRERVNASDVVAPPYDVISPSAREELYNLSPFNIARVDAGLEEEGDTAERNKYTRASAALNDWLAKGVLVREQAPAYYAYRMTYSHAGRRMSLTGIFALVSLVELGKGVYPHEATHSKPKQDRLSLVTVTGAHTSPVYSLVRAPKPNPLAPLADVTKSAPYMESTDLDGSLHSMWIVNDASTVAKLKAALAGSSVFIADGHHRYETALEYRRQRIAAGAPDDGGQPFDYVLMFLADIDDKGLTVLPTHRLVTLDTEALLKAIDGPFLIEELPPEADIATEIAGRKKTLGLYLEGRRFKLTCSDCVPMDDVAEPLRPLDVVMLHKLIFGRLVEVGTTVYEMDCTRAMSMVDRDEFDAAFFLNPTAVADVERVALAGLRMPPKSTYFFPKVQTGFIINTLKTS